MNLFTFRRHQWWWTLWLALALVWPVPLRAAPSQRPAQTAAVAPATMQLTNTYAPDLEAAARAVVRIEATGTFVYPKTAETRIHGGSGFIIDPSGLAVTNNHIVTGAAYLSVYLPGESKARNAKVLGVDECADLAVIDIEGDDFPYLAWSSAPLKVGTPVYAAGYPLGDPEYALTSGIIGKAQADGQTSWSSLDYVLQHDANLNPGNSGGPLLEGNGQVVGINYASNKANQHFAISGELAGPIIEQLRTGLNLDTIGVNGEAFSDGDKGFGIWVYSVRSGSPADETGIQPGDILLEMEGVPVGSDATMATYCDILRGHQADDVIALKVWRSPGEIWGGQLNGRPLSLISAVSTPATPTDNTSDQPTLPPAATDEPPAATPTVTPTPQAFATVQASSLNIRKGPGTGYGLISHVNRGDTLKVLGQVANCAWLKIETSQQQQGWVAGAAQWVTLDATCNTIPLIPNIPIINLPAGQGCMTFQNNINAELTITFTSKDGKWNETFKVARKAQQRHCFTPGEYTFTVDAPPPWESYSQRIIIPPGANIIHPVNPG